MNGKKYKIGIVVPAYNCEHTILRLIKSIYDQNYDNYSVVIVNDGSKDRTKNVIETFLYSINNDKRFKLINKKNEGVSEARNVGLRNISCDYILFADSDDWFDNGYFYSINNNVFDYDLLVYSYNYYKNGNLKKINCKSLNNLNKKNFYELLNANSLFNNCWNKVYKFDLIKNLSFNTNISYGEDYEFVMRFFTIAEKYKYIDESYYNYDLSTGNLGFKCWDNSFQLKTFGLKALEELYDKYNYNKKTLYKGYVKAFILDLTDYIIRKEPTKSEFFDYRNNCYNFYDLRKIKVFGLYGLLNEVYNENCFIIIVIISRFINCLKMYKLKNLEKD